VTTSTIVGSGIERNESQTASALTTIPPVLHHSAAAHHLFAEVKYRLLNFLRSCFDSIATSAIKSQKIDNVRPSARKSIIENYVPLPPGFLRFAIAICFHRPRRVIVGVRHRMISGFLLRFCFDGADEFRHAKRVLQRAAVTSRQQPECIRQALGIAFHAFARFLIGEQQVEVE
jgi:hypothetical protein